MDHSRALKVAELFKQEDLLPELKSKNFKNQIDIILGRKEN